jgi:hypothetical protein
LNCIQTSSDAWGDVENSGELFGKAQSAMPRKHGPLLITVAFARVKGECWQENEPAEVTEAPHRDSPTFFPVSLTGCRRFDRSQSLRRMVQYTPYTFLAIEQNLS